jgi:hypothetical protein
MTSHNRRHFSSPNIVLATGKSSRGPGAPTIKEEEDETIVVSRSDGVHHDIVSVFANPGYANMINTNSQRARALSADECASTKESNEHDKEPNTISITRSDGLSHDIVKVFRGSSGDSSRSGKMGNASVNDILISNVSTTSNNTGRSVSVDANAATNMLSASSTANTGEKIKAGRSSTFAKIADLLTGKSRTEKEKEDVIAPGRRSFTMVGQQGGQSAPVPVPPPTFRIQNEFFMKTVRIVHMSDTHNLLRATDRSRFLPSGNILVHTGNFTCFGKEEEFLQFNSWLESVADIYHYRVVILGHKDVKVCLTAYFLLLFIYLWRCRCRFMAGISMR